MATRNDMRQKLDQKLDLSRVLNLSRDDDGLMLEDHILIAALDGSRPLAPEEREALQKSPITLLRFRHLALQARARKNGVAANDAHWRNSTGMLRAADGGEFAMLSLRTDDHYWKLDFVPDEDGWQFILSLDVNAPFAARLMQEKVLLRVRDGAAGILLEGQLDEDGECEARWPLLTEPARHLQKAGAVFRIELNTGGG